MTGRGKRGKPKPGFHSRPTALGNRPKVRFPHSNRRGRRCCRFPVQTRTGTPHTPSSLESSRPRNSKRRTLPLRSIRPYPDQTARRPGNPWISKRQRPRQYATQGCRPRFQWRIRQQNTRSHEPRGNTRNPPHRVICSNRHPRLEGHNRKGDDHPENGARIQQHLLTHPSAAHQRQKANGSQHEAQRRKPVKRLRQHRPHLRR